MGFAAEAGTGRLEWITEIASVIDWQANCATMALLPN